MQAEREREREREREVEEDKCFGGVDGYLHNGAAFSKRAISGDYIASRWVPFSCRASLSHDATFYLLAPKRRQKVSDRIKSREMFLDAHQF